LKHTPINSFTTGLVMPWGFSKSAAVMDYRVADMPSHKLRAANA